MDRNQLLRENQEFKQYTSSNWRYSFLVIVLLRVAKIGELNWALIMRKIEIFLQMLLMGTSQDLEN